MKAVYVLMVILVLSGCAVFESKEEAPPWRDGGGGERIDIHSLKSSLALTRPTEQLGFEERRFNTCNVGSGYSPSQRCRDQILTVLHLRLQCRDTDGTVSSTEHRLTPIHSNRVKWGIGGHGGFVRTDSQGYGQIHVIAPVSLRKERMLITISEKFLAMTAEDMSRVVAPKEWCRNL